MVSRKEFLMNRESKEATTPRPGEGLILSEETIATPRDRYADPGEQQPSGFLDFHS
jgi:hypothetical protein